MSSVIYPLSSILCPIWRADTDQGRDDVEPVGPVLLHAGQEGGGLEPGQGDHLGAQDQGVHRVDGQAVDVEHGDDGEDGLLLLARLEVGDRTAAVTRAE